MFLSSRPSVAGRLSLVACRSSLVARRSSLVADEAAFVSRGPVPTAIRSFPSFSDRQRPLLIQPSRPTRRPSPFLQKPIHRAGSARWSIRSLRRQCLSCASLLGQRERLVSQQDLSLPSLPSTAPPVPFGTAACIALHCVPRHVPLCLFAPPPFLARYIILQPAQSGTGTIPSIRARNP